MTKEDILMMARNPHGIYAFTAEDLSKFAGLVAADEREACARIVEADADARGKGGGGLVLLKAAERIRARGEK